MKVAKLTTYKGDIFYTDNLTHKHLRNFFSNVNSEMKSSDKNMPQVDIIDMTKKEYHAIPATNKSHEAFKE